MEENQKDRLQDITKMMIRASNVEEMRDCLGLVEGLYEEIPQLIDEERVLELREEKERKIEEKKKRNERRMEEEKIEYRSQKIQKITDHYNSNNSSGGWMKISLNHLLSLYHDQSSLTSSTRINQLKDDTGSNEDEELRRSARKRRKEERWK